jgi:phosphoadenosine phosphosulfate reductase
MVEARAVQPLGDLDGLEQQNHQLEQYLREMDFEAMSVEDILRWAATTFPQRAVINTSLQYSGVAMIHMAVEMGLDLRLATIDTLRLHPETYDFIKEVEAHYSRTFEVYRPQAGPVHKMVEIHGEFLFFDSKFKQEHCCKVRKEWPNARLLKTVDCWITGVRRDQSSYRQDHTPKATLVPDENGTKRKILKLNPLADWSEARLRQYIGDHTVPTHPLYDQGYQSFGCIICSTPTRPDEAKRAGRWRWFNSTNANVPEDDNKECGLHVPSYNI